MNNIFSKENTSINQNKIIISRHRLEKILDAYLLAFNEYNEFNENHILIQDFIQDNTKTDIKLEIQQTDLLFIIKKKLKQNLIEFSTEKEKIIYNRNYFEIINWKRFLDLRDLCIERVSFEVDNRDIFIFWMGVFLSQSGLVSTEHENFKEELRKLAECLYFSDYTKIEDEAMACFFSKLEDQRKGRRVIINKRVYPQMYTPTNKKLIEIFHITCDEQKKMRTIFDCDEKLSRADAKVPGRADRRKLRMGNIINNL